MPSSVPVALRSYRGPDFPLYLVSLHLILLCSCGMAMLDLAGGWQRSPWVPPAMLGVPLCEG